MVIYQGGSTAQAPEVGAPPAFPPLASPPEGGGVLMPPVHRLLSPRDDRLGGLGALTGQGPAHQHARDRLGQVQPTATQRGGERQHALRAPPLDDGPAQRAGQVVPDQDQPSGRQGGAGGFQG